MSTKLLDEQSSKKLPWTLNNFEAAHETCIFPLGEDPKTDLVMAFWAVGSDLGSNSRFNAVQYPLGDTNCNATRGHPDGIKMETCWLREPGKYVLYGNKFWLNLVAFVERERMMSFGCWCGVWFVSFSISFYFLFVMFERPCFLLFWSSNDSNPDRGAVTCCLFQISMMMLLSGLSNVLLWMLSEKVKQA